MGQEGVMKLRGYVVQDRFHTSIQFMSDEDEERIFVKIGVRIQDKNYTRDIELDQKMLRRFMDDNYPKEGDHD
jgi:hypothetical protein